MVLSRRFKRLHCMLSPEIINDIGAKDMVPCLVWLSRILPRTSLNASNLVMSISITQPPARCFFGDLFPLQRIVCRGYMTLIDQPGFGSNNGPPKTKYTWKEAWWIECIPILKVFHMLGGRENIITAPKQSKPIYLPTYLAIHNYIYTYMFVCLFVCLSIYPFVCLSIGIYIYTCICDFTRI